MTWERAEGPSLTPHISQVSAAVSALARIATRHEAIVSEAETMLPKRKWPRRRPDEAREACLQRLQSHYDEVVMQMDIVREALVVASILASERDLPGAPPSPESTAGPK